METKLDLILLGATGFVGKAAVRKLAILGKEREYSDITWGISGRSREKLEDVLSEIAELEDVDTSRIPIMQCDVTQEHTVAAMTIQAKIVLNATGPNTVLSPPIIKACVETGTHYVDITAEKYHLVDIYREFNRAAKAADILIVPACGFAALPVAAGLILMEKNFDERLRSVQCYTELDIPWRANFPFPGHNNSLIHYGTWHSLVLELCNYKKYVEMKKQIFTENIDVPSVTEKSFFHCYRNRLWFPYPSPEQHIVEQTQIYQSAQGQSPYHFSIYATLPLFIHFLIVVPVFFFYYLMCSFSWFKNLLIKFPKFFTVGLASHKGPSNKMRLNTKFSFTLTGKGWNKNQKKICIKISGYDPNVEATCIPFVYAAITILRERSSMPKGGVLPSPIAFRDTQIVQRLQDGGLKIELGTNSVI